MTTTFMGHELPPLRGDNVWTMHIYPGGRKEVRQTSPEFVDSVPNAVRKLASGQKVRVALDDAVAVLMQAKLPVTP